MKLIKSILFTIVICLTVTISANSQDINGIKIVRGMNDTVSNPNHTIVGTAKQGSEIYINNKKIYQYSTGSFGTEVKLTEGDNLFEIKATNSGNESLFNFSVFYKASKSSETDEKVYDYPNPIVITKPGAYLNYGAGQDRLGGAKIR